VVGAGALLALMLAPAAHAQLSWSGPTALVAGNKLGWVACPSVSQCTAIDNANGSEVTFDPANPGTPTPRVIDGGPGILNGLACPSTSECVAADNGGREVTFNPANPGTPTPVKIDNAALLGPACPSASQCTAVDTFDYELTFNPVNPGTPTPNSYDFDGNVPTGIACPSASQCTAVDIGGGTREVTFNPASTATRTSTTIDNNGNNGVSGIACPSTSQCTAVDPNGRQVTFNPVNPGTPTPTMIDNNNSPTGIACPSTSECVAIDQQGNALEGNPTGSAPWAVQRVANANTSLDAVACPSTAECVVVDNAGDMYVSGSVATKIFQPPPIPRFVSSLAALWNRHQHCSARTLKSRGFCDLLIPVVRPYYLRLLVRTGKELDGHPAAAAAFFQALTAPGLRVFVDASEQLPPPAPIGLLPSFPAQRVPTREPDGMQVLGIALLSGKLSTDLATRVTLTFLHPHCNACGRSDSLASLAAITIVDYYWGRGQLLTQSPGSAGQALLRGAIKAKVGWNTVTLGAAAYAASQLPAANPPAVDDLTNWIYQVKNGLVAPLVTAMGRNWIKVAQHNELASKQSLVGIKSILTVLGKVILSRVPVLGQVAGLVLGMLGARDTSGIAREYTQVIGFANENQSVGDLFCLEALLQRGRIHRVVSRNPLRVYSKPVPNTRMNLQAVWKAYVTNPASRASKVYAVTVLGNNGQPTPDYLDELPLGVPSFIAANAS
jgi:hypothetical protein